jgi:pyruvate ferredoxin oxidoreductase gamma subunit
MFQIRIHGRGGQGVVTAAEMLSVAAFREGRFAQAFPSFGSERTGAPVVAFCRLDDKEIRLREPIMQPDALIIQDPTLLHQVDVFAGLVRDGYMLINTTRSFVELGMGEFVSGLNPARLCTVPATEFAQKHLGRPVPNAALLGGFAAVSGRISHLRRGPGRTRRVERALRGAPLPVLRQLLRVRQLLWRVSGQRGDQAGAWQAVRVQPRLLQGLRAVRRGVPVRRDQDGARRHLTRGRWGGQRP